MALLGFSPVLKLELFLSPAVDLLQYVVPAVKTCVAGDVSPLMKEHEATRDPEAARVLFRAPAPPV